MQSESCQLRTGRSGPDFGKSLQRTVTTSPASISLTMHFSSSAWMMQLPGIWPICAATSCVARIASREVSKLGRVLIGGTIRCVSSLLTWTINSPESTFAAPNHCLRRWCCWNQFRTYGCRWPHGFEVRRVSSRFECIYGRYSDRFAADIFTEGLMLLAKSINPSAPTLFHAPLSPHARAYKPPRGQQSRYLIISAH